MEHHHRLYSELQPSISNIDGKRPKIDVEDYVVEGEEEELVIEDEDGEGDSIEQIEKGGVGKLYFGSTTKKPQLSKNNNNNNTFNQNNNNFENQKAKGFRAIYRFVTGKLLFIYCFIFISLIIIIIIIIFILLYFIFSIFLCVKFRHCVCTIFII